MVMRNYFPLGQMKKGLDMVQSFNTAKIHMALLCSGDGKIMCWYLSSMRCVLPSRRHWCILISTFQPEEIYYRFHLGNHVEPDWIMLVSGMFVRHLYNYRPR
ncbi:hypothetical protein DMS00_02180 [Klebsiella variicola]|nr:hypothetical protein DMS00_02180 [Klebsiella variicola]PXL63067.1 hypothetical protein DMS63_07905 [Klebsiella variicola]